jgi:hypothetical protein
MGSDFEQFRKQLDELGQQLAEVRGRVARLEGREAASAPFVRAGAGHLPHELREPADGSSAAVSGPPLAGSTVALIGRTLIVLGGAYLFRALSDRALVPPLAGAGAAWVYALLWLVQCDRTAARGQRTSAVFHGITGTLIAYPLLWETTAVFGLLPPAATAAAMLAVLGIALWVASRRALPSVAWVAVVAHVASGFALMVGTQAFLPLSLAMLGAAGVVEIPRLRDSWPRMRWPAAFGADAAVLVLVIASVRASRDLAAPEISGMAVLGAVLALPLIYLASVGERTVHREQPISGFEVGQVTLALLGGLAGGAVVQGVRGASSEWIGLLALLLALACYATALGFVERRLGRGRSFHVFSTFAGVLGLAGPALLSLGGPALVVVFCAFGVVALALGALGDRSTLRAHGALYGMAAAVASGLVCAAGDVLLVNPAAWRPLSGAMLVALAFVLGGCIALMATMRRDAPASLRLPQAALAALLVALLAALLIRLLVPAALALASEDGAPAALAALRSVVMALLAVALAVLGRRLQRPELHWLVYPLLVLGGIKLVWEDLRIGEPVALFAAFAAFGFALLVTPRLMRQSIANAPAPDAPVPLEPAE